VLVEHWQGCFGFRQETFRNYLIVRTQITIVPPFLDTALSRSQWFDAGQFIALLSLVYAAMRRKKIPEIVARPRGRWETVVDVERTARQGPTASHTIQFS